MKTFEAIEKELSDKSELFSHLPDLSRRIVPWNAVRFYTANHSEDKNPCLCMPCEAAIHEMKEKMPEAGCMFNVTRPPIAASLQPAYNGILENCNSDISVAVIGVLSETYHLTDEPDFSWRSCSSAPPGAFNNFPLVIWSSLTPSEPEVDLVLYFPTADESFGFRVAG